MSSLLGKLVGLFAGHNTGEESVWDRPSAWLPFGAVASPATRSGIRITRSNASTVPAFFAGVRAISEDMAKVPLRVMEKRDGDRIERPDHFAAKLLQSPNDDITRFSFRESLVANAILWGNGYAEIVRDGANRPKQAHLIHPSRVTPERTDNGVIYKVRSDDGTGLRSTVQGIEIPARDIIHIRAHGDDLIGISSLAAGAEALGIAIAAQNAAGGFFGNGMQPGGVFVHPGNLGPKEREGLREYLHKTYGGSQNAGKNLILWGGIEYKQVGMPPKDAQLLEAREFQIDEIARILRIPLTKLQKPDKATYSNTEQEGIAYVVDCLTSWASRVEQEFERKLTGNDPNLTIRHQLNALVRGDMKMRGEFYRLLVNIGAMSPDEVRAKEEMNAIGTEASRSYFMQSNMTTIDSIAAGQNLSGGDVPRGTDGNGDAPTEGEGDDDAE